jgi:hypothetical protein
LELLYTDLPKMRRAGGIRAGVVRFTTRAIFGGGSLAQGSEIPDFHPSAIDDCRRPGSEFHPVFGEIAKRF